MGYFLGMIRSRGSQLRQSGLVINRLGSANILRTLGSIWQIGRGYVGNQMVVEANELLSNFLPKLLQSVASETVASFEGGENVLSPYALKVGAPAT